MDRPPPEAARHRLRTTLIVLVVVAVSAMGGIAAALAGCRTPPRPHPTPQPATYTTGPTWAPTTPAIPGDTTVAWAYLDSAGGTTTTDGTTGRHRLDQLVIPGIAADYLHQVDQRGHTLNPNDVATLFSALAQNADAAAELTRRAGGLDTVLPRIIDACRLTGITTEPARATALDTARYAACLREGGLADQAQTRWVLDQMRVTAGGIGDVRGNDGGQHLAQFNSTEPADQAGRMRTGCLAVGAYWSAAVFVDWPQHRGELFGVAVCAEVARTTFPPDTQPAPETTPAPATTTA